MLLLLLLNNLVAVCVVVRLLVGFINDNDDDDDDTTPNAVAVGNTTKDDRFDTPIIAVVVRALNKNTVVEQHRNCMSRLSLSLFLS